MRRSKIVNFPNSSLKNLKNGVSDDEGTREKIGKIKDKIDDDSIILVPVKYAEKSRHDKYYFVTRRGDYKYILDESRHIRVDAKEPLNRELWKLPKENQGLTRFHIDNLKEYTEKYMYLPIEYIHTNFTNYDNKNEHPLLGKFVYPEELEFGVRIDLANGDYMSLFTSRPNEYGLLMDEEDVEGYQVGFLRRQIYTVARRPMMIYEVLMYSGNTIYLTSERIDDGFTYVDYPEGRKNRLIRDQQLLFYPINYEPRTMKVK